MKRKICEIVDWLFDQDDEVFTIQILATFRFKRRKTHEMIKNRDSEGIYRLFITKYLLSEEDKFVKYLRVTPYLFHRILEHIRDHITTTPTNRVPNPISPQQKLCVALRFVATGESITSISFSFRIAQSYVTDIVRRVFKAIKDTLMKEIPHPTKEQFSDIASDFYKKWNFPNVLGCLDGKHVRIRCPNSTGSIHYNYKDFFSIVLLALVDANNKFIAVDIGSFGREGDAGIFSKCEMGKAIRNKTFDFPQPSKIPGTDIISPYVVLGDEAFPLLENLMKPFCRNQSLVDRSKAIFNYRLSRARRIVENAFGILAQRFRIYNTPIHLSVQTVENLVASTCIVHNMIIDEQSKAYRTNDDFDERTVSDLDSFIEPDIVDQVQSTPQQIRDTFKDYFTSIGSVSWQNDTFRL